MEDNYQGLAILVVGIWQRYINPPILNLTWTLYISLCHVHQSDRHCETHSFRKTFRKTEIVLVQV